MSMSTAWLWLWDRLCRRPPTRPPAHPPLAESRDRTEAKAALRSAQQRDPEVRSLVATLIDVAEENGFGESFAAAMRAKGWHR